MPDESRDRNDMLSVTSYDVFLDITRGDQTFLSRAEIHFRYSAPGDLSFADLRAVSVRQATAQGHQLAGQGLYRVTDSAEGSGCMYAKAYRGGAARMYCCFDVPRLRAPITFSVRAPAGWSCLSNAAAVSRPPGDGTGSWRFAPTAPMRQGT